MGPKRSLWPAAVATFVLLAIGVMILPGSEQDSLAVLPHTRDIKWEWGSRTSFPDHLDDTDEWGHYGVVRPGELANWIALGLSVHLPSSATNLLPSLSSTLVVSLLCSSSSV